MKKSTIALIVAAVVCLGLSAFSAKASVTRTNEAIEEIGAVKGTFTNAGQFQVIIGNDVPIFYNDFTAVSGIEGVYKEAA